jgi:hypothetical protein
MITSKNAPATQPEIANPATTRNAQTAAKEAHPEGKAAPAKVTSAMAPPAKKALAAETGPKAAPAELKVTKPAIRWSYEQERGTAGAQTGASPHGVYRISADGDDKWLATVERDNGAQTVLGQGISHGAAYARRVVDFKAEVAK